MWIVGCIAPARLWRRAIEGEMTGVVGRSPVPERTRGRSLTPGEAEWSERILDRLDQRIESVRSNASDRLVGLAQLPVRALVAAVTATMALVLLVIGSLMAAAPDGCAAPAP